MQRSPRSSPPGKPGACGLFRRFHHGHDTASDADIKASIAHLIQHADFFDQSQRLIERQCVDKRAEPQALGAGGDGGEEDAGARR